MPTTFTVRVEDPSGVYEAAEETRTAEATPKMGISFPDRMYDNRPFAITVVDSSTGAALSGKKVYLNGTFVAATNAEGKVTLTVGGTA